MKLAENPSLCYQCAKCSTGCPVSSEMDVLPHQIIHLLGLGLRDRALAAKTLWMCAGCYACAVRCPNDIDITSVMDDLRSEAAARGLPCPNPEVLAFHRNFLKDLGRRGKVHEFRMMGEYNLRTRRPFRDAMLGVKMLLKGRLHVLPPRSVRGFRQWMKKLWQD